MEVSQNGGTAKSSKIRAFSVETHGDIGIPYHKKTPISG